MKAPLLLCLLCAPCLAGVRLPSFFVDHMVLQRDQPLPVWGWADAGESVNVSLGSRNATATAGADGRWRVTLEPQPVSASPLELAVKGRDTVTVRDVLLGDVWLVSGQSNSVFGLGSCQQPEDVASADFPLIRYLTHFERFAAEPQDDVRPAGGGRMQWRVVSPATAASCSALGFYFARAVHRETGVPIGILTCGVGGTRIECWLPGDAVRGYPENADLAREEQETFARWRAGIRSARAAPGKPPEHLPVDQPVGLDAAEPWAVSVRAALAGKPVSPLLEELEGWMRATRADLDAGRPFSPPPRLEPLGKWLLEQDLPAALRRIPVVPHPIEDRHGVGGQGWFRTSSLYNGMTHPLIPFGIRGMLWYQGENGSGTDYAARFRSMVEMLRRQWGRDFPVYFVQLPNYGKPNDDPAGGKDLHGFPRTREQQLKCLAIPGTGMAVTIDTAEGDDLHPRNKRDVGERVALLALAGTYGKAMAASTGPLYQALEIRGAEARVSFTSVGRGLMIGRKQGPGSVVEEKGGQLKQFALSGGDRKWFWAQAVIDGDQVVVTSPDVPAPVAVRYAYSGDPKGCNLYNREGLPASPFRTDAD